MPGVRSRTRNHRFAGILLSLVGLVAVAALGISPANAATATTSASPLTPGLGSATCPKGSRPNDSVVAGRVTALGLTLTSLTGSCVAVNNTGSAAATVSEIRGLGIRIGAVTAACHVNGTSTSTVDVISGLHGISGTITAPVTVHVGPLTISLNVDTSTATSTGKIAVQITLGGTTIDIAEVNCAITSYPIVISGIQNASGHLPAPTGHSGGSALPALFLLVAAGVFLVANVAGLRILRRRRGDGLGAEGP
ncbi:MAG TPA: hypothetical protein VHT30_12245 [Acidimicrobiales bacterium]|jgi:hypothetical protein|nr:hypothetical protein [Acidimicrobiales bacterium]